MCCSQLPAIVARKLLASWHDLAGSKHGTLLLPEIGVQMLGRSIGRGSYLSLPSPAPLTLSGWGGGAPGREGGDANAPDAEVPIDC